MLIVNTTAENNPDKSAGFRILFWRGVKDMKDIKDLTYKQLLSKYRPFEVLSDDYILKYYWDEQVLEIDRKKGGSLGWIVGSASQYFSIVLNDMIIYHGISRTILFNWERKDDYSNYPAITFKDTHNKDIALLVLKPKFLPIFQYFRDYDEKEKKKILNKDVLKYFKKQGKIIMGKVNIKKIYGRYDEGFKEWIL